MTCALKASSSDVFIATQAVRGEPDAAPVFHRFRRTEGRITQQNTFEKSAELKTNLQSQTNALTDVAYQSELGYEMTQNFLVLARSILMVNEETMLDLESTALEFSVSAMTIKDTDLTNLFVDVEEGQWLFVKGASDNRINKPYYVTQKIDDSTLLCTGVDVDWLGGENLGISGLMLRSGNTEHVLTAQGRDPFIAGADGKQYKTQIDAVVDTYSIEVPETGLITGSSTLIASTQLEQETALDGQTDAPDDESPVLGSAQDFKGFWPDQVVQDDTDFTEVTIEITRNTGTQSGAGKLGAKCVAQDVIAVTGTLNSIRKASDPAAEESKFDNAERFAMSFGFQWPDNKWLVVTMRKMIYTDGSIPSASGDFANFNGTYDAEQDEYGTTIQFDTNISIDDYLEPDLHILVASGDRVDPCVLGCTGDFRTGDRIQISGERTGTVEPTWGVDVILQQDYDNVEDFAEALADFINGNIEIHATPVGNTIEILAVLDGLTVGIVGVNVTPA